MKYETSGNVLSFYISKHVDKYNERGGQYLYIKELPKICCTIKDVPKIVCRDSSSNVEVLCELLNDEIRGRIVDI